MIFTTDTKNEYLLFHFLLQELEILLSNLPYFLQIIVRNSLKNGNVTPKGRRYDMDLKNISTYLFLRGGTKLYEFLSENASLPSRKTITHHINRDCMKVIEGKLYVNELLELLNLYNLPKIVCVSEDDTKVVELVEYNGTYNCLTGLVAPIDNHSGFPKIHFFKANNAQNIREAVQNGSKSTNVHMILAKSISPGNFLIINCLKINNEILLTASPTFLLSYFGTDGKFTHNDVIKRMRFMYEELKNVGIKVCAFSSDGISSHLKAQKFFVDFGAEHNFFGFPIIGNLHSEIFSIQDVDHVLKKLKTRLYDESDLMIIGSSFATLAHLIIIYKKYDKLQHKLILSDIDASDTMNYSAINKIINDDVINLMRNEERMEGTVCYLEIMRAISKAFKEPTTSAGDRLFHAAWTVCFLRIWKSWMLKHKVPLKNFLSDNAHDCIELNFLFLLHLSMNNFIDEIYHMNSQTCEHFFRMIRSMCGMDSLIVNSSILGLTSRIKRWIFEEKIMQQYQDKLSFQTNIRRAEKCSLQSHKLNVEEIFEVINSANNYAQLKARKIGIILDEDIDLKSLFKQPSVSEEFLSRVRMESDDHLLIEEEIPDQLLIETEIGENNYEIQKIIFDDAHSIDNKLSGIFNGKRIQITKQKLLLLLQEDKYKMSNDLRRRFISKKSIMMKNTINSSMVIQEEISRGDCIILKIKEKLFYGRLINFQFQQKATKSERKYSYDFVCKSNVATFEALDILLDPCYELNENYELVRSNELKHLPLKFYITHAPTEHPFSNLDIGKLEVILQSL
jgi:hypothetical protein